ncbi:hypothetical protein K9L27_03300 [Candidatus Gracilibacteria bacterium]|nr:hypothetical protein [Candidatus Gracilibacteria bacterium]
MKLEEVFHALLSSPNIASQKPIFEKYDKNVQGNTAWERGAVAASIMTPFRDYLELSETKSKVGVAVASGGNPNIARISARTAAEHAVVEAIVKVSCVGGIPLAVTDCLNFGNPEKADQMGEFVEGVEGIKTVCEAFNIPIVSGNVSFYNESSGRSIPPSAIVSVFARVEDPSQIPCLALKSRETIFLVGERSNELGGSEFLKICHQIDTRLPQLNYKKLLSWLKILRDTHTQKIISAALPILRGGLLMTLAQGCFQGKCGAMLVVPSDALEKIPQFLFSEAPGVLITTEYPEKIRKFFGSFAQEIGKTTDLFHLEILSKSKKILTEDLTQSAERWENKLREIF